MSLLWGVESGYWGGRRVGLSIWGARWRLEPGESGIWCGVGVLGPRVGNAGVTMCGESDENNTSGGRERTWDAPPGAPALGFSVRRMRNPRHGVSGQEELLGSGCVCVCGACVGLPI